jgi:hypothetical protein
MIVRLRNANRQQSHSHGVKRKKKTASMPFDTLQVN